MKNKHLTQIQKDLIYKLLSEGNNNTIISIGMSLDINTISKYKQEFGFNERSNQPQNIWK